MNSSNKTRFILMLVAGVLVTTLGYRQYQRMTTPLVWVASTNIPAGSIVGATALVQQRGHLPRGSVINPREIVGKRLLRAKNVGDSFFPDELERVPRPWLADQLPPGRVLHTLIPRELVIPHNDLRRGDRVDVVAIAGGRARLVARDAYLIGALNRPSNKEQPKGRSQLVALAEMPGQKNAATGTPPLVLGVHPEEVFPLAEIGKKERIMVVLHGSHEIKNGKLLSIAPARERQVELIVGLDRRQLNVTQ